MKDMVSDPITIVRRPHFTHILLGCRLGVTIWHWGAISFLWRGRVGPQIVFGDWWEAHPEVEA